MSTFVLISQNRTAAAANKHADLDLQINLPTEHELTKLTELVATIAARLDVPPPAENKEVKRDVAPEAVLDELEAKQEVRTRPARGPHTAGRQQLICTHQPQHAP